MIVRTVIFYLFGLTIFYLNLNLFNEPHKKYSSSSPFLDCELIIDRITVGDCVYGDETGNSSKLIIAAFVNGVDIPVGDLIVVDFQGQQEFIDPFDISCPQFASFIVTSDGSTYDLTVSTLSGDCSEIIRSVTLPENCDPLLCQAGISTGGKVYSDYNSNGVQDSSENGIVGIPIKIYGDDQLLAETMSGTNGIWATNNITPGIPIRVEFEVPSGLFDGGPGAESNTNIQMAASGECGLSLGINATQAYVDEDPWISTTYFSKGDVTDSISEAAGQPTIVLNKYFTPEGGPVLGPGGNYYISNAYETGSVWGLSYQKSSHNLFSSAFLKRQAAWGPHGLGAIYRTSLSDFFPDPPASVDYEYYGRTNLLLNLDHIGIETGDESTINRDLPQSPNAFSHDSDVFDLIGKWGLGDMDINDEEDILYVVNLFTKSIVVIEIGNPLRLPITANSVTEVPIPNPGCSDDSDWRPWGLKYHDNKLYVGGVCSAESTQNPEDLWAYVYAWDGQNFESVVDFNLSYPKGPVIGNLCTDFIPWSPDFNNYRVVNDIACGPSPVLSDIEFDPDGNMILGIGDRFGYQTGGRDYGPDPNDMLNYISFTGGDILKLYKLQDDYLLEKNASSGFYTSPGANNNEGVCGGEFFFEDAFYQWHRESALGALALHPSYNTVLSTLMDPATVWSNGWSQLNNSDGRKNVSYSIFAGEIGTFGKSAGLGDIELLVGSSTEAGVSVSVGNYVWFDEDEDGIQDPEENPVPDLMVKLYDVDGVIVDSTLTSPKGLYYFTNLLPDTEYYLTLGELDNYSGSSLLINGDYYVPCQWQVRMGFGNKNNDSDARNLDSNAPFNIQNFIGHRFSTSGNNENDFSLDFGLITCRNTGINNLILDICQNDSILFMDQWFSENHLSDTFILHSEALYACDSIVQVQVNVLETSTATMEIAICPGESVQIGNETFDENRLSGIVVYRGQNINGCDSIVQVELELLEHSFAQVETSICPGETVQIGNEVFDENRLSGDVIYSGQNIYGCDSTVEVNVTLLEESFGLLDTILCPGEMIQIDNQIFDENFTSGSIRFSGVNFDGCDSILDVNIDYYENLLGIQYLYEIDYGDSVQLEPYWYYDFEQFYWTPDQDLSCVNCAFPWASPLETTDYFLTGIDINGCPYETKTKVVVRNVKNIYIPNIFSPNGDGVNDFFTVYATPFLEIVEELLIFDRWGNFIIRITDFEHSVDPEGWDGTFKGRDMNPAVFAYVARVRWKDGERGVYHGDVTLIR